ncbi:BlaI/MecI/CopY family transcriptional regulator [Dehalobacterium formicoaceticum]|uniref:BlaI/MecI/CopY family transcriptional regulator n=1 Tax=Dehalobacterium formicoaceticum TaxID=51515 RepID=A0ABT1XZU4_9FIRM|nr:BlaI/MecI/CopY family transcriptional regulator [Dehalobacterium formicoaceticum]MCR6544139.1 BlaI/MecI/CopY family transcriptional regulator [Dehalobacterium formicoaceticum]
MAELKLTEMEAKFADIIWANEPIPSGELVKLCEAELDWKKSTTYTILKRLAKKGIFENKNGIVSSHLNKEAFYAEQSKQFVEEKFEGSLPRFLAAFTRNHKLNHQEIDELQKLIDEYKE